VNYQAPPLSPVNKALLIAIVALFVLHSIGQALGAFSLVAWFGLLPADTIPWRLHTLFTYPWLETNLLSVLFNGLVLWFLGSELERSWGRKLYIKFILTTLFIAGMIYTLVGTFLLKGTWLGGGVLVGPAGLTYGLCVAYAVLYPDRQFLMMFAFPVKARWFCLIMAGVELYMGLFSGNPASWGHLFSMGVAFLLIRYQTLSWVSWWLNDRPAGKKNPGHLRLVKEEDKPKYWH
jgi:membrane associated rhomboid family serine protease